MLGPRIRIWATWRWSNPT